ncbi:MAG: cytochrome C [Gammaproteobacteria bacterium]|nr:MAG: cytochrome C [Gammaproteobacteria bacterium]
MKKIVMALATTVLMASPAFAGDAAAGKVRSAMCAACHGAAGVSAIPMYPNLAGQKEAYIVKQLKAFKAGTRKDPVMSAMAAPLSDTDIANLAAHYSSLK